MKKSILFLSICICGMAGCGNEQDEIMPSISDVYESETVTDVINNSVEAGSMDTEPLGSTEAVSNNVTDEETSALENEMEDTELPSYLKKMSVYFDENGELILDNDGFLYRFIIDMEETEMDSSASKLVFGEAYDEVLNFLKVTCYPIELFMEPENILLGTLAQGTYFYPNSEYFDENYLRERATMDWIYGYVDHISQESVSVFTGEENWLQNDTYLELVNVSDTAIDIPLAEDVRFALLDRNFLCTEVTAGRFQQLLDEYEQEKKPAGPIFILYLQDGKVVQILEHYNP